MQETFEIEQAHDAAGLSHRRKYKGPTSMDRYRDAEFPDQSVDQGYSKDEKLRQRVASKRSVKSTTASSCKMTSRDDLEGEAQQHEVDKYDKVSRLHDLNKQKEFQKMDLGMLKILNLVVIVLSLINLVFSMASTRMYRLQNISGSLFPVSMLVQLLVSVFGQLAVIRVEQKNEKYYFSEMSGTFSFEALMVFFRLALISTPFMFFLSIQTLMGSSVLST
jgi:hypothetical protein